MENKDLEFHYLVSYREGFGWTIAADVEDAVMTDGTIYDWNSEDRSLGWFFAYNDSDDPENSSIADLDTEHYSVLSSALRQLNGEY